jgi:hypothetical protein
MEENEYDNEVIIDASSGALLFVGNKADVMLTRGDIENLITALAKLGNLSFYGTVRKWKELAQKAGAK